MKMKTSLFALALTAASVTSGNATTVIFAESFGNVSTTTTFATHTTNNGFDNNSLSFSGNGDIRSTAVSTGYTGASGNANVWLTNSGSSTLVVSGISTLGFNPGTVSISFGALKTTIASDMSELLFEYSSDGASWTTIAIPAQATGSGTAIWRLVELNDTAMPITETLSLRWTNTASGSGTPSFRIDDVTLTAIPEPTTALLGGLGFLALLRRRRG